MNKQTVRDKIIIGQVAESRNETKELLAADNYALLARTGIRGVANEINELYEEAKKELDRKDSTLNLVNYRDFWNRVREQDRIAGKCKRIVDAARKILDNNIILNLNYCYRQIVMAKNHNSYLSQLAVDEIAYLENKKRQEMQIPEGTAFNKYLTAEEGHVLGTCKGFDTAIEKTVRVHLAMQFGKEGGITKIKSKMTRIEDLLKLIKGLIEEARDKFPSIGNRGTPDLFQYYQNKIYEQFQLLYDYTDAITKDLYSLGSWIDNPLRYHLQALAKIVTRLFYYIKHMT